MDHLPHSNVTMPTDLMSLKSQSAPNNCDGGVGGKDLNGTLLIRCNTFDCARWAVECGMEQTRQRLIWRSCSRFRWRYYVRPSGNTIQRLVTSYFSLQAVLPYRAPLYILVVVAVYCRRRPGVRECQRRRAGGGSGRWWWWRRRLREEQRKQVVVVAAVAAQYGEMGRSNKTRSQKTRRKNPPQQPEWGGAGRKGAMRAVHN
jgi:hypothetical protein